MVASHITGENISLVLFFIGLYGTMARRNILKTIISLSIMQVSIILFFISMNEDVTAPPILDVKGTIESNVIYADPLPQALMITAVVIGISVTALCLTLFISLYHKYGTTNWKKVKSRRETS